MVSLLPDDYIEETYEYRERASITLSQNCINAVRLRIRIEMVQSPLAPYENLKYNPSKLWYGTCTRLYRGAVLDRREIEPTATIVFDETNEHFLRRLDEFRMWSLQYEWNIAISRWLQAFMIQWINFPAWGEPITDLNETLYVNYQADLMDLARYCVYAKSATPINQELDAFGFNFDQIKIVCPPGSQFIVRLQYWRIPDTCDDTIVDLASARQPGSDPFGRGSTDPYEKPATPPAGGDPYALMPPQDARNPLNDPRDYANAPLPDPGPDPSPSGNCMVWCRVMPPPQETTVRYGLTCAGSTPTTVTGYVSTGQVVPPDFSAARAVAEATYPGYQNYVIAFNECRDCV